MLMYANDTVFVASGEDNGVALHGNQRLFNEYVDWTGENGLKHYATTCIAK